MTKLVFTHLTLQDWGSENLIENDMIFMYKCYRDCCMEACSAMLVVSRHLFMIVIGPEGIAIALSYG